MPSAVAFGAALSVGAVRAGFRRARGLSDESENRPLIPLPAPPLGIPQGDACYQRDARRGGVGGGVCIILLVLRSAGFKIRLY